MAVGKGSGRPAKALGHKGLGCWRAGLRAQQVAQPPGGALALAAPHAQPARAGYRRLTAAALAAPHCW